MGGKIIFYDQHVRQYSISCRLCRKEIKMFTQVYSRIGKTRRYYHLDCAKRVNLVDDVNDYDLSGDY